MSRRDTSTFVRSVFFDCPHSPSGAGDVRTMIEGIYDQLIRTRDTAPACRPSVSHPTADQSESDGNPGVQRHIRISRRFSRVTRLSNTSCTPRLARFTNILVARCSGNGPHGARREIRGVRSCERRGPHDAESAHDHGGYESPRRARHHFSMSIGPIVQRPRRRPLPWTETFATDAVSCSA